MCLRKTPKGIIQQHLPPINAGHPCWFTNMEHHNHRLQNWMRDPCHIGDPCWEHVQLGKGHTALHPLWRNGLIGLEQVGEPGTTLGGFHTTSIYQNNLLQVKTTAAYQRRIQLRYVLFLLQALCKGSVARGSPCHPSDRWIILWRAN